MAAAEHPPAAPRAVLFDWHATLVDTHDAMYRAVDEVLPRLDELGLRERLAPVAASRTLEDAKLVRYVRSHGRLHPRVRAARKVSRTDLFELLFGADREAKDIAHRAFDAAYRAAPPGPVELLEPDAPRLLAALRAMGVKLGLLSNRNRAFVRRELAALAAADPAADLGGCFDVLVCGDDAPRRKPDPAPVLAAVAALGLPADPHCWCVGDSTTDVVAARRAGATAVFYNGAGWERDWLDRIFPGTARHPHRPHAVVASLRELLRQARRLTYAVPE